MHSFGSKQFGVASASKQSLPALFILGLHLDLFLQLGSCDCEAW